MKAVVLLSGGLDSTTALFWAKDKGYDCVALSVRYGQRHERELRSARLVAKKAGVPLHEVELALPWLSGSSSLTNRRERLPDVPLAKIGRGVPSTYVPARNTVFLSMAASLADALSARAIVIGANVLDYSGYPDCRPEYLRAMEGAIRRGTRLPRVKILAPLVRLDKAGIVRLARRVGAPIGLTWSCYAGGEKPCGRCDSCKLRAKGFSEARAADEALT